MHLQCRATLVVALTLLATAAPAAAEPFGDQTPLAEAVGVVQSVGDPAIAYGNGESLVVWREVRGTIGDRGAPGPSIGGRFVDGQGLPVGDPFFIGVDPDRQAGPPDVAYNPDRDEYLVVFRGANQAGYVYTRVVKPDGTLTGGSLDEDLETNFDSTAVARVAYGAGEYLLVWDESTGSRGNTDDVFGRRISGDGQTVLDEAPIRLSENQFDEQLPDVAYDAKANRFLTVFVGVPPLPPQRSTIQTLRILATSMTPEAVVSDPVLVGSAEGEEDQQPAAAANENDGGFGIVWTTRQASQGTPERAAFFSGGEIAGRVVSGTGAPVGDPVALSPDDDDLDASYPGIAYDPVHNEYLVDWWARPSGEVDITSADKAYERRASAAMQPLGDAEELSITTPATPARGGDAMFARAPVVAFDKSTCTYVTVYEIYGSQNTVAARGVNPPPCAPGQQQQQQQATTTATTAAAAAAATAARVIASSRPATALPRRCTSRRTFRIRLVKRRGRVYRSVTITVNGRRVRTLRGSRLGGTVNLTGLPAGTFRVTLTARLEDGRVLRSSRRYRTCRAKQPPSNNLGSDKAL